MFVAPEYGGSKDYVFFWDTLRAGEFQMKLAGRPYADIAAAGAAGGPDTYPASHRAPLCFCSASQSPNAGRPSAAVRA